MRQLFTLIVGFLLIPAIAQADVSGVDVQIGADKERIILHSDVQLAHKKLFLLAKPDRLVVDFPAISAPNLQLPTDYKGQAIQGIRFGRFDAQTSRIVLDLKYPVTVKGSYSVPNAKGGGWQYVLDIAGQAGNPAPKGGAIPWPKPISTQETPVPPAITPKPAAKKPLIVIDAGHGGQDPGAIGIKRSYEKHITLDYAKSVRDVLLRSGRYRVLLTRSDDRFIMLGERVNIARKAKADIFISLHADSNPRKDARGLSVYTLSETASDAEAEALAEQENKSDIIGGMDLPKVDEEVANILIDLVQRETMTKSGVLADHVVESMHDKINLLPNPHRYAGFRVLKAPDTPSILVEIGFLSNPQDEQLLGSKEFRGLFSGSILKALDNHFADKRS
ncbi:MAG: N-acetylmuramoyl-L-alanine amidase [Alphaproteobacteria bacterium]|nr:N-acetylmuramoyl-L-alanine amidase [Alphaproteobacteria bacterium]